jgi:hypothetical protein
MIVDLFAGGPALAARERRANSSSTDAVVGIVRARTILGIGIALLVALPISARQETAPDALSVEDEYSYEVQLAEGIGRLLFTKVALAAQAQQAAQTVVERPLLERAHSWVAVIRDAQWHVRFVGSSADLARVYYEVRFSTDGVASVTVLDPPTVLDREETGMLQAKQSAIRALPYRCADDYLAIALRTADDLGWTVYLLATSNDPRQLVVGGHFRITLDLDGLEVQGIEPLSKGCLEHPQPQAVDEEAGEPTPFWIMNELTPTPLETHVLLGLLHDLQIQVGTSTGAWIVSEGRIEHAGVWPSR